MASPEQRIYQKSPTAPTPRELKDGLRLLIGTFGKGQGIKVFNLGVGSKQFDGKYNTVVQFRSGLDKNGSGCIGFNTYKRQTPKFEIGRPVKSDYEITNQVEVHLTKPRRLIAVDHNRNIGKPLTDAQRRGVGQAILNAWESAVAQKPKPSKR